MNARTLLHLLSCLLLVLATGRAAAELYTVEVIVFAQGNPDDQGEAWPSIAADGGANGRYMDDRITRLAGSARSLGGVRGALQQAGHRVLLHSVWRQPAGTSSRGGAFPFRTGSDGAGPRLDGFVRLVRSRYLHLDVDLQLSEPQATLPPGSYTGIPAATTAAWRLQEKRRVRYNELHYFDHPRFGILARVTPHASGNTDGAASETEDRQAAPAGT